MYRVSLVLLRMSNRIELSDHMAGLNIDEEENEAFSWKERMRRRLTSTSCAWWEDF